MTAPTLERREQSRAATLTLAAQAARAQALLDRIATVSDITDGGVAEGEPTISVILERLDAREVLLSDLEPVVAELAVVREQLADQGHGTARARALDLALAPVEAAARRALSFHELLLQKMQAMRDEMVWELDRLDQLESVAHAYMPPATVEGRLDVRR